MSHIQSVLAVVLFVVLAMYGLVWLQLSHQSPPYAEHRSDSSQTNSKQQAGTSPPVHQNATPHEESRAAEAADRKEKAEEALARYTYWLMLFTGVLAASTIGLWLATRDALNLGREEFAATHRPRIVVHKFEFTNPQRRVGARFTYVNAGAAPARVIQIGQDIFWEHARPSSINMKQETVQRTLAAGESDVHIINSEIDDSRAHFETVVGQRKGAAVRRIMCVGYVRYADERGAIRETGFCRVYDASAHTWMRVENADYEYSY